MTTTNIEEDIDYGGRIEISMEDYENLSAEEDNVDYELIDYPVNGITNEQMTFALSCSKLFPEGSTFICKDSGTYTKGHIYQIKITDEQKSWEDITISSSDTQSDEAVLYIEQNLSTEQQNQVCSNLDLESKFVKAQTANSGELKVYCINETNPNDVCRVTTDGLANSIPRYTTTGQLKSRVNPTEDNDLVRLAYIKDKLNHSQVYFGTTLPSSGIGTTYLENDVFILSNSNGTKNFYQLNYIDNSSSLSWHDMVDFEKPKWQVFAPSDTSQVLMTEVTIITSDEVNFTGMDGKKVIVNGYTADGFQSGTVVCDEIEGDITYSPAFIGSITSTRASGVFIKGSNSVTIVNENNPEVTFTYRYLW